MNTRLLAIASLAFVACAGAPSEAPGPWLDVALASAHWLESAAVATEHGRVWSADPARPAVVDRSLYAGSPGVVLFFLELARTTGDDRWLALARAGADDLLAHLPPSPGLYTGLAGAGYVLGETARATGDRRYLDGVGSCVAGLERSATMVDDRLSWGSGNDVIAGAAGIGLFLLWSARELDRGADRALAERIGADLQRRADPHGDGLDWPMNDAFPRRMPNFSHGTAGVATFFAQLHCTTGRAADLDAAVRGARWLEAIADRSDGGFCVGHDTPDHPHLMYLGWCHGPCGTALLFRTLFHATGQLRWRDLELACAGSVLASGLPEQRLPGFWNNVSRCCGSAGVIEFMLDLHRETGDARYLAFAQRCARDLLARAVRDEHGARWPQAEHRVRPDLIVAQTGLMQGAAGIGLALLHLDAAERGRAPAIRLPDEPQLSRGR